MNSADNIKVLVVEDEPAHAEMICRHLEDAGNINIREATSLEECLQAIAAATPDIILIDLHLPDGGAIDLLPKVKGQIPVITITSRGSEEQAVEVLKAGAVDYLTKSPQTFAAMARIVKRALREWRLQRDKEQAIAALQSSEQRFRVLLENVQSVAVQGCRLDGTIFYWNRASEELYKYTTAEAIGKNLVELVIPPEHRETMYKNLEETAKTSAPAGTQEMTVHRKDGSSVTIYTSCVVVNRDDRPAEIYCFDVDISARKKVEDLLLEQKSLNEAMLQNTATPLFVIDPQHRVLVWNKACEELTGVKAAEIVGTNRHWSGFYDQVRPCLVDIVLDGSPPDQLSDLYPDSSHSELLDEGLQAEGWRTGADGEPIYLTFNAALVRDSSGTVIAAIETLQDITPRKKAEDELLASKKHLLVQREMLEQANRELKQAHVSQLQSEKMASIGQLAAGVAHEINNPIGFVSSNLRSLEKYLDKLREFMSFQDQEVSCQLNQELRDKLADRRRHLKIDLILDDIKDLLAESRDGTERVGKIVQDLKGFSRIDEAEYKLADIIECLESSINIVWNEIKYKASLNRDFADLPLIPCYPGQLNQVFVNLLVNAAQAITEQGTIDLKTWEGDGHVYIQISDSGCGISPENCKRIFDPFFTTKEVGKGTGLGLSISYDIIKKHQGEIHVASEADKGTSFTIKLPTQPIDQNNSTRTEQL